MASYHKYSQPGTYTEIGVRLKRTGHVWARESIEDTKEDFEDFPDYAIEVVTRQVTVAPWEPYVEKK